MNEITREQTIKDIEITIEYLKNIGVIGNSANKNCEPSLKMAIESMQKLEQIEQIIADWKADTWTDGKSYDCMVQIGEVVEHE